MSEKEDIEADDEDTGEEIEQESQFDRVVRLSSKQLMISLLLLCGNILLLFGGILSIGGLYQAISAQESELPFNRIDELVEKTEAGKDIVTQQYAEYINKMEDKTIFAINSSYNTLYDVSQSSEKDYGEAIFIYRDAIFSIASNVRGSGVWYEFYSKDVAKLGQRSRARSKELDKYGELK